MSAHEIGSLGVIFALVLTLFVVFRFTKFGLAMRAAAVNPPRRGSSVSTSTSCAQRDGRRPR